MFLENVPDLKVTIHSNGQQLPEYDDEDSFPSAVEKVKFIEAESGANFTVNVTYHSSMAKSPKDCLEAAVFLNGHDVTGYIYSVGLDRGVRTRAIEGRDKNTSRGPVMERFQFANLQTTDGPIGKVKHKDIMDLGEITVKAWWVHKIGQSYVDGAQDKPWKSAIGSSVPEKCLKGRAISNLATMGAPEVRGGPPLTAQRREFVYGKDPFATFKFKYRSRRDLQAEGIIPRSPSPVPLENRDPETLNREELLELNRLRARDADRAKVKLEGIKREGVKREGQKRARSPALDSDGDPDEVTIIDEGPSRKRTRASTDSAIEIVDLTED